MTKGLTIKQRKYVLNLARLGNKRQAVIDAGYKVKSREQADSFVYWLNKSSHVRAEINSLFYQAGLTKKVLARKLADATKQGWGVKATHTDALHALKMTYKLKSQL